MFLQLCCETSYAARVDRLCTKLCRMPSKTWLLQKLLVKLTPELFLSTKFLVIRNSVQLGF